MAAKKTTTKRTARKAASKKRRSTKAPSKAQLAARAKFAAAAKARSKKAAKKKNPRTTLTGKRGDRRLKTPTESHLASTAGHWYSLGWSTKQVTDKLKTYGVTAAEAKRITRSARSVGRYVKGHLEKNPKRAAHKTVIVKPRRVLVINGKKKAAKKRNGAKASPKAKQIRKDFTGMESKKTAVLLAPKGTPRNLAKLGKLILIKTERGTIKPPNKGTTWLCADTKGKLHVATSVPYDGPAGNFGEVIQVEYETAKPSLGYKNKTIFFHKMGEEGGRRPTLSADKEGLRFRGGSYKITRQGIVD